MKVTMKPIEFAEYIKSITVRSICYQSDLHEEPYSTRFRFHAQYDSINVFPFTPSSIYLRSETGFIEFQAVKSIELTDDKKEDVVKAKIICGDEYSIQSDRTYYIRISAAHS